MASLREITTEQFSDGTTIGGGRIDRALASLLRRFNNLGKRDIKRRWLPTTYVGGYMGSAPSEDTQRRAPWLICTNGAHDSVTVPPAGAGAFENPQRVKGHRNDFMPVLSDLIGPGENSILLWTTAYAFRRPAIIVGVSWTLMVDDVFTNTFEYMAGFDALNGEPVEDLFLEVSVDDTFLWDNARLSNPEVHKLRFGADSVRITPLPIVRGYTDMLPDHPKELDGLCIDLLPDHPKELDGLCIDLRNLNVPLPAESRVRLALGIPAYDTVAYETGWNGPNKKPWQPQYYSFSMHVLESVEE